MRRIHIAGMPIQVGDHVKQLCAWCGFALVDLDLASIAVPESDGPPRQHYWEPNTVIEVIEEPGFRSAVVMSVPQGERLPPGSCVYPGGLPPLKLV